MHVSRAAATAAIFATGVASTPAAVAAATYQVSPVRLALDANQQSGLLTVHNQSAEAVRFQVTSHAWSEGPDGAMRLTDTSDLIVFPTMLSLKPNEKRKVRVSTAVSAGAAEKTYRVFVEELPPLAGGGAANGVRVLTRMGIPIFLRPNNPVPKPAIANIARTGDTLSFAIKNAGNAHFVASKIRIKAADSSGKALFTSELAGWYVLAGGVRRYDLDLPSLPCDTARVAVAVETAIGAFESAFDPGVKSCGP